MNTTRESDLAELLNDLLAAQDELIEVLTKKRRMLAEVDTEGLASIGKREEELVGRLQKCIQRRGELLQEAAADGLPADSIQSLATALPSGRRGELGEQVGLAKARARLLRHHSLINWAVVQRSLIHLSQMLEIIATGGRMQPTYGKEQPAHASGVLVDQDA
jgi:hypothetical protein